MEAVSLVINTPESLIKFNGYSATRILLDLLSGGVVHHVTGVQRTHVGHPWEL